MSNKENTSKEMSSALTKRVAQEVRDALAITYQKEFTPKAEDYHDIVGMVLESIQKTHALVDWSAMEWKPIEEASKEDAERMQGGAFHYRGMWITDKRVDGLRRFETQYGRLDGGGDFVDEYSEDLGWPPEEYDFYLFLPPPPEEE